MDLFSLDITAILDSFERFFEIFINSYRDAGPFAWLFAAFIESVIPMLPLTLITLINIHSAQQGLMGLFDPMLATWLGWVVGFIISWIGTSLGASVVFIFHRYVLGHFYGWLKWKFTRKRYEPLHRQSEDFENGIIPLFAISIIPYSPSSIINFTYAFSKISTKSFILTTLIAKFFMMFLVSIFANVLIQAFTSFNGLTLLVMALTGAIWLLTKHFEKTLVGIVKKLLESYGPKRFKSKEE